MTGQDHAGGKWHGQPLVRIDGNRIGPLDAPHQIAMLVGKDRPMRRKRRPRATRVGGACRFPISRPDRPRFRSSWSRQWPLRRTAFVPMPRSSAYRLFQFLRIELRGFVHRDAPQRLAPDSQQAGRLVQRMMRLGRSIEHGLARRSTQRLLPPTPETSTPAPKPGR